MRRSFNSLNTLNSQNIIKHTQKSNLMKSTAIAVVDKLRCIQGEIFYSTSSKKCTTTIHISIAICKSGIIHLTNTASHCAQIKSRCSIGITLSSVSQCRTALSKKWFISPTVFSHYSTFQHPRFHNRCLVGYKFTNVNRGFLVSVDHCDQQH